MPRPLLLFFCLLLMPLCLVRAQDNPGEEIVSVKLRFLWASPAPLPPLGMVKGTPPVFSPVAPVRLGFGPVAEYRGTRLLRLYRPPTETAPVRLVGEALLPAGDSAWIAVVRPRPDTPEGIAIDFVPENVLQFPLNSFLIVNLTGSLLDGRFAGADFTVRTGLNTPLLSSAGEEPPPSLQLSIHYKQRVIPLIDTSLIIAPDTRGLLFVLPPPRAGSRNILTFFIRDPQGPSGT